MGREAWSLEIDGQKKARVQMHSGPGDGDLNTIP